MRNSKLLKITLTAAAALTFASFAESSAKADTQADIDAITQKIKDTEKSIKEGQEKLSKLEDLQYQKSMEIDGLKKNIKARKAQLARQARAAQVNNAGSMIDFVSKSNNLSEAISRTFTVATLVHADQEKVVADKAVVDKAAADQTQANKNFNNDLAQLAVQKTQLEVKKANEDEAARKAAQEAEKKAREAAEKVADAKNERDAQNALKDANNAVASVTKSDNNNNVAAQASTQQTSNTSAAPAAKYGSVVGYALSFQGVPYVYGGTSPSGFDCSGLVQYVFAAFGKQLPRTAGAQKAVCTPISESQLQPGDLVFWGTGHVGIYIGGGNFVHAPTTGDHVKVTSMNYYHPDSYGRVN